VVLALPDLSLALSAAQLGVGLALLPEASITAHVARGELMVVLEQTCPPPEPVQATAVPEADGAALMLVDFLNAWPRSAD
jgi:DNA-binding transcriptional LysR family regulator